MCNLHKVLTQKFSGMHNEFGLRYALDRRMLDTSRGERK